MARLDDRREDVPLDRRCLTWLTVAEHLRVQQVGAGVDVAGDQVLGLLPERQHAPVGLGGHQAERPRILHVLKGDRDGGSMICVERTHRGEVEIGEDVAVQGEERLVVEMVKGIDDRSAGAEWFGLGDPGDARL
jgi:hypothetical protein